MVMYRGQMSMEEVREEAGVERNAEMVCYTPPEKPYHPLHVALRMDEGFTKVYTDEGKQLHYTREYYVKDGTGCVYAEFHDDEGNPYYFIGYDDEDVMYHVRQQSGQSNAEANNMRIRM